jgi:hypothetical protein
MRGLSLSGTGLGTSALYNCMPPTPRKGKDGNGKDNDAHPAQPLNKAAPEQQPSDSALRCRSESMSPGGRKSGNGFKKSIHKKKGRIGKIEWQRAEQADGRPSHSDNGHAFPLADGFGARLPETQPSGRHRRRA